MHSGCYNKLLQNGWLLNNRNFFLMVLEARKSKLKMPADLVSGKSLLPCSQMAVFLLCSYMTEGMKELSGVSYIKILW